VWVFRFPETYLDGKPLSLSFRNVVIVPPIEKPPEITGGYD
jgi:hypothetical protein